jgi:D-arabinonate dehydratase
MKITDVKLSDPVYIPFRQMTDAINTLPTAMAYSFLRLLTDEGVTGLSITEGGTLNRVLIEESLKPYLIGEDPLNNERIWEKMYWATLQYGRRGAAISALSALDIAVWDLKGKILGQSVHRLLGGHRDTVASYGSGVNLNYTDEELVKEMTDYVAGGFRMVKMKIGKRDPADDLSRVKLVRQAIGPDIDLAVDVNNGWSLQTAIRMAHKLEEYDIYWLEEPILADEIDNLARLARETRIPIAVGENHYTKWEFKELMEQGAMAIVQADVGKCGGVTEFIKIAALADAYGLPVCPHHTEYIDAPLVAAIPNGLFHEYIHEWFVPMGRIFIDPIKPANGEVSPLDKPGFGIELNEAVIEELKVKPAAEKLSHPVKKGWRWPPYL